jgi:predicted DNA-binding transcriptional regulator AlpA
MDSQKPERFLSVKEFANMVGWGEDTIRRLIYRKLIRAVLLPQVNSRKNPHRRARIPESEIARFVRMHSNL